MAAWPCREVDAAVFEGLRLLPHHHSESDLLYAWQSPLVQFLASQVWLEECLKEVGACRVSLVFSCNHIYIYIYIYIYYLRVYVYMYMYMYM